MKIQIDTKAKTIKVGEDVKFNELIKVLKKLLPKEWEDYTLESSSILYWYNPIQWTPTYPTKWTYTGDLTTTVYNVEVN